MRRSWATFGVDLHLDLDPATGRRAGLEGALRDAIRAGRLAPHARLPSSRALAAELGLARGTVSAAYDQLVAEGFLTSRQGSGTEVAALEHRAAPAAPPPPDAVAPRHDLRPGRPDLSAFPTAAWLRATRRALAVAPSAVYDYGDPCGRPELRAALAAYLGRARGVLATPDRIVVTSGFTQSLTLLAQVLGDAGTTAIAMEDPGLDVYREVVRRAGPAVRPLPVDGHGARTERLAGTDAGAVLVTPAHQYPTGVPLHPARRRALLEWARATGGLIVEDDYDGEFRYDRQPVGALQGAAPDLVAYAGTVSKTLGPGLRLGWLVLPRHLVEPVARAKFYADHHTEAIGQLALAELIAGHDYDRHVRACRLRYRRRRDLLLERLAPLAADSRVLAADSRALAADGSGLAVRGISAGLHALVGLPPEGPSEAGVLARAQARGLAVEGLAPYWQSDDAREPGVIVGFGASSDRAYPAALDALAAALSPEHTPRG